MPIIRFDVLIDAAHAAKMAERFDQLSALMIRDGVMSSADTTWHDAPAVDPSIEGELRKVFVDEREEDDVNAEELVKAYAMNRWDVQIDGATKSINEITMTYARLLTPPAKLPNDHVAMENEEAFEVTSPFPWTVEILR